jgi:cell wall-associated NlpC family hydrolase
MWATHYIKRLLAGKTVQFRPRGNSMSGKIDSGQWVTVEPVSRELRPGDIVLCKVRGTQYLHLIKAVSGETYQIGNNRGRINGWTSRKNIFGMVTRIEK